MLRGGSGQKPMPLGIGYGVLVLYPHVRHHWRVFLWDGLMILLAVVGVCLIAEMICVLAGMRVWRISVFFFRIPDEFAF